VLLDYNQKLFLTDAEKKEIADQLNSILNKHHIDKKMFSSVVFRGRKCSVVAFFFPD
jgi:hypothetical protein